MDWNLAIERHSEALKRIVAMLFAMAGLSDSDLRTLPRPLHRAVLRLLRPAESAVRRLIIIFALTAPEGSKEKATPARLPTKPKPTPAPLWTLGRADIAPPAESKPKTTTEAARRYAFPLIDPLRRPFRRSMRYTPAHLEPRIWASGGADRAPLPSPPSPDAPVNAARLGLRITALAEALDDLPGQARRFERWRVRRDRGFTRRLLPLKPGLPPGSRRRDWLSPDSNRRPSHEIHEVLHNVHGLAFGAVQRHDTS
ncbi:MAG: hypothetical protein AB7I34_10525 [Rhizobiaceae bacterium]